MGVWNDMHNTCGHKTSKTVFSTPSLPQIAFFWDKFPPLPVYDRNTPKFVVFFFRFFLVRHAGSPNELILRTLDELLYTKARFWAREMTLRNVEVTTAWGGLCFCCFLFFWGHEILFGLIGVKGQVWVLDQCVFG